MERSVALAKDDLAYWVDADRRPVKIKIKLVTNERVYVQATETANGRVAGEMWFEDRSTDRILPRIAYIYDGRAHFDWRLVIFITTPEGEF